MKLSILFLFLGFGVLYSFAQTSGGPDTYGYIWRNSNDAQGPTYNWIDITTSGTQVVGLTDDNSVPFITMSQPFHYYWADYTNLKIGSNGWLSFDNIPNIAHCFPTLPTAGGAGDNILAPFMSDLIFNVGAGEVWYYDDVANDQFIVSYINAPWWSANAPGYIGSNTFQVILSSADSSITYQYQTVDPANFNNTAGCLADLEIGIENMTGNIGLEVYNDIVPANNLAIRFEYPDVVTFQVQDPAPSWSQTTGNNGSFVSTTEVFSKDVAIENFGNTDVTTDIIVVTEVLNLSMNSLWSQTDTISTLAAGQIQTIGYSAIGPFPAGQYFMRTTTTNVNDLNPGNNVVSTELEVVDLSTNPVLMTYATQTAAINSVSWSSGGGAGAYFVPASYPMTVDSVQLFIMNAGVPADYTVTILDDDGVNGMPGTILASELMVNGTFATNAWVTTAFSSPVTISSGGFYVGWEAPTPSSVSLGIETTGAISRNSLEYLGSWEVYRENNTTELLINAFLTNDCINLTAVVDSTSDLACFGDTDGAIYVTISGEQGALTYDWTNGAGTNEDPTGLGAGTYDLTYTDALGCSNVISATISAPADLVS